MMDKNAKIYVAGHRGMVGSAILRELEKQGYGNIVTRTHQQLNLCSQQAVEDFFCRGETGICIFGGGEGGRHRGQRKRAGGFHV